MYRKEKRQNNFLMIIITISLLIVSVFTLITNASGLPLTDVLRDPVANIEYYLIRMPINYLSGKVSEFSSYHKVYQENKELQRQNASYQQMLAMNETLSEEIKELKDLMSLTSLASDYQVQYTTIIQRENDNWQQTFVVDAGKNKNITPGMAVITAQGMVGVISKVNSMSSTVTMLSATRANAQVPVQMQSDGHTYYGLIDGYDDQKEFLKVTLLSGADAIAAGTQVVTSGLGGANSAPKGLLVGEVDSYLDANSSNKTLYVKSQVDFYHLSYVAIVSRGDA